MRTKPTSVTWVGLIIIIIISIIIIIIIIIIIVQLLRWTRPRNHRR